MIDQLLTSTAINFIEQGPQQAFWSFLFGAALSIGSALLKKPKAPPAPVVAPPAPAPQVVKIVQTKTTPNIQEGVDAAKAAGFNPLTAAQNGLIQGFQTTQTPFLTSNPRYIDWQTTNNRNLQIQQDQYNYQQQKSQWRSSLLGSIGSAVTGFSNYRSNQVTTGLQNDLLRSEIFRNNSQANTNYSGTSYGSKTEYYNPVNSTLPTVTTGDPYSHKWENGDVTVTNPWKFDSINTDYSDAEASEQRYGEVISELSGIRNFISDYYISNVSPFIDNAGSYFSNTFETLGQSTKSKSGQMKRFSQ